MKFLNIIIPGYLAKLADRETPVFQTNPTHPSPAQ